MTECICEGGERIFILPFVHTFVCNSHHVPNRRGVQSALLSWDASMHVCVCLNVCVSVEREDHTRKGVPATFRVYFRV